MSKDLRDLFIDELRDIYDAEHRLTHALQKLAKAANSEELVRAFESHLEETKEHAARIERIFESMDKKASRKTCKAMVGLIEEGQELIDMDAEPSTHDAALIAAAQKVEHYEIASYGCLRTWADQLGEKDAARLLQQTLDEEGTADERLTEIAETLEVESSEEDGEDDTGENLRETVTAGRKTANAGTTKGKSRSAR